MIPPDLDFHPAAVKEARRAFRLVRRFPYVVVYRQIAARVQIVAVAHGKRKPGYWKRRK
jgi:plasmid stabilization system protein ParE